MAISREVLQGFVAEARGYLPQMRQEMKRGSESPDSLPALATVHRCAHSIKGAAAMIGLPQLAEIANYIEESVEMIGAGQIPLDGATMVALESAFRAVDSYLAAIEADALDSVADLLPRMVMTFRRLRELPAEGDEDELRRLTGEPPAPPTAASSAAAEIAPQPPRAPRPAVDAPRAESPALWSSADSNDDVLESFLTEAEDSLAGIGDLMRRLAADPGDSIVQQTLRRAVHTLKGSSAMIGLTEASSWLHRMEDLLESRFDRGLATESQHHHWLFDVVDLLEDRILHQQPAEPEREDKLQRRFETLAGSGPTLQPDLGAEPVIDLSSLRRQAAESRDIQGVQNASPEAQEDSNESTEGNPEARSSQPRPSAGSSSVAVTTTRVANPRIDDLIHLVGELVVNRSTFEQHFNRFGQEIDELHYSLSRLSRLALRLETDFEVAALGDDGRAPAPTLRSTETTASKPASATTMPVSVAVAPPTAVASHTEMPKDGFDSLEMDRYTEFHLLTRGLAETRTDIAALGHSLNGTLGNFESYLSRLNRLTGDLQERLMRLRMAPVAELESRLHRTVRVTAQQVQKDVQLVVEGQGTELDKAMREEISDSLLHILRNAVDHGIEPPAMREALGKPRHGTITFRASYEGTNVVIRISDDGGGIDPQAIQRAAVSGGYMTERDARALPLRRIYDLLFTPGFSTAGRVSEVSGRGVGLDVVKTHIHKSKGSIAVRSELGVGTTFTIRLPLTLALMRSVVVRVGSEIFAVPETSVHQILRIQRNALQEMNGSRVLIHEGDLFPATFLSGLLPLPSTVSDAERLTVLLIEHGDGHHALITDDVVEAREIAVKSLGSVLRNVNGISGATLTGDGGVVLIVDPDQLLTTALDGEAETLPSINLMPTAQRQKLEALIVDDSVSVRRIMSNLVQAQGWEPIAARDGLEALEIIQTRRRAPDVVLLDIEMPRMDGYEVLSSLRAKEAYAKLPIIMLTSRAGAKHRRRAVELGVSEYLVKPFRDETLVAVIRRLVREAEDA